MDGMLTSRFVGIESSFKDSCFKIGKVEIHGDRQGFKVMPHERRIVDEEVIVLQHPVFQCQRCRVQNHQVNAVGFECVDQKISPLE